MSGDAGSTALVESQAPTPGQAQRSKSPSEEKAMDSSTSSTAAPTVSAQSTSQEQHAMSTDSSTPSNGASSGSTQDNASSGDTTSAAAGDTSAPTASSASDTAPSKAGEKKRSYPGKYLSSREKVSAQKALAAAEGATDPTVVAEVATVQSCEQAVQDAQGKVLGCVAATRAARTKLAQLILELKPAVLAALWTLRCQPQGREFARSLEGKTESATAQKILSTVPSSSGYRLSADALKQISDALPGVQTAEQELAAAEQRERDAAAAYRQAVIALEASVTVLGAVLKTAKFRARIPAKAKPSQGQLRLAKTVSAHAKKKAVA